MLVYVLTTIVFFLGRESWVLVLTLQILFRDFSGDGFGEISQVWGLSPILAIFKSFSFGSS